MHIGWYKSLFRSKSKKNRHITTLLTVGLGMLYSGIKSVVDAINGAPLEAPGIVALVAAAISIITKEILYRYTVVVGKRVNSEAVIANAWHHRSDAFSSIGTLIGIGGAIFLGEKRRIKSFQCKKIYECKIF